MSPIFLKKDAQIYSAHAELLLWTLAEGDLDFALKMDHPAPATTYAQGKYEKAGFDFDPGFRVALLYFRAPHFWEVKWQYTRMALSGENSVYKPKATDNYLTGTWPLGTAATLTKAESYIHFNYNLFDMSVSRVFIPNPHLRLRTIVGTVLGWMSQYWNVRYEDAVAEQSSVRNKWEFIGGGLKGAMCVDWYWTGELYMTAGGTLGVLMGSYNNHAKQSVIGDSLPIRNAYYSDVRPTVMAQMFLGPSWQKNFQKNRMELYAGFEMNSWSNLQEIYRSTSGTAADSKQTWINSSLLCLYGLSLRATLDF